MSQQPSNPRAVPGSNSEGGDLNDAQLVAFVERIERVAEELRDLQEDRKEIYAEAKALGYDAKIIRKVVARRRADRDKLDEEEALIDLYEQAIARQVRA